MAVASRTSSVMWNGGRSCESAIKVKTHPAVYLRFQVQGGAASFRSKAQGSGGPHQGVRYMWPGKLGQQPSRVVFDSSFRKSIANPLTVIHLVPEENMDPKITKSSI